MKNNWFFDKIIGIDIAYDMRRDSDERDPDKHSTVLKNYHKKSRSKKLPNGDFFELNDDIKNIYLHHKSKLGEYFLSSDSIIHTYSMRKRMSHIIEIIPKEEINIFKNLSYTIGCFILFPSNKVNNLSTINQERGVNPKICDRIDLTLEYIRLYYINEDSPLKTTLLRYNDYFKLFTNFKGYCEFFFLQDLTSNDYWKVKFFLPFNGFENSPLPKSVNEYLEYRNNNISFVSNRNKRIEKISKNTM